MKKPSKYALYEGAVQSPETHVEFFNTVYSQIKGKPARVLREDFCGTFALSAQWVKTHPENRAIGLDLDPEPLAYGKRAHESRLSAEEKKRLRILKADVMSPRAPRAQLIAACNFSFFIFKRRELLRKYFERARRSLTSDGVLLLEMAGGPGMIEETRETKSVRAETGEKYRYVWHQKSFDPITHDARYAIHFHLADGSKLENAFTYDWRLWTIPEVRELLMEAGYSDAVVFWEMKGDADYEIRESGDNAYAWIAYVAGVK